MRFEETFAYTGARPGSYGNRQQNESLSFSAPQTLGRPDGRRIMIIITLGNDYRVQSRIVKHRFAANAPLGEAFYFSSISEQVRGVEVALISIAIFRADGLEENKKPVRGERNGQGARIFAKRVL